MVATFILLREAYEKWWAKYPDEFPASIRLTDTDWDHLTKLHEFLKALNDAVKFLEGPQATLERVLPTMEFILEHFEQGKVRTNIHVFFAFLASKVLFSNCKE
jgi:hypothetical protein